MIATLVGGAVMAHSVFKFMNTAYTIWSDRARGPLSEGDSPARQTAVKVGQKLASISFALGALFSFALSGSLFYQAITGVAVITTTTGVMFIPTMVIGSLSLGLFLVSIALFIYGKSWERDAV